MGTVIDFIGLAEASRILGISPSLLHYRARTGKIPVVRQRPTLRFRLSDLLDYQRTMPPTLDQGTGRKKSDRLEHIIREVLSV